MKHLMKIYWYPSEAIIATIVATAGIGVIYYANPVLHPLAYVVGWLVLAALVYQTGCEFTERRLSRIQRRAADDS